MRPLEAASRESGMAWRLIAPRLRRQKRALDNLALAFPDMPLEERERIAGDMWENLGRTFAEGFFLKQIMAEGRVTFEPMEQLREIARGGPCIVCGLHLGNWELVAYAGKLMGAPFTGVYQRLSNPYVDAATLKLREAVYEGGLLPRTTATARTLLKTAKAGRLSRVPCRSARRSRRGRSFLRRSGALDGLPGPARPHHRPAPLRRRRVPPPRCPFRHPRRAHTRPRDQRPRGRRHRRHRRAAEAVRNLHPRGARAVDVGAQEVGRRPRRPLFGNLRDNSGATSEAVLPAQRPPKRLTPIRGRK